LLALSLLTLASTATAQEDGRLQKAREEVQTEKKNDQPRDKDKRKGNDNNSDDDDDGLGRLWAAVLVAPWLGPHLLLGDDFNNDSLFRPYPYANHCPGLLWIDPYHQDESRQPLPKDEADTLKRWMARVTVDDSDDFRGLNRAHAQALLDTNSRFGLQTDWWYLHERLSCGCIDEMGLGDLNVVFRFAECDWIQMRTGLGVKMLFDQSGSEWGVNFVYGADIFPADPWVVSLEFDAGTLGHASVVHGRATVGAIYHGWELFAGYDLLRIGSVDLSGPVVGLRVWF
jgi:hypothetical protein